VQHLLCVGCLRTNAPSRSAFRRCFSTLYGLVGRYPPSLRKHRLVQARGPCLTVVFLVFSARSICGQKCIVFRDFRLPVYCCELHVQPWLSRLPVFHMQQASVRMSTYGTVFSVYLHQQKSIWVWTAVNCEPVVACCSHAVE